MRRYTPAVTVDQRGDDQPVVVEEVTSASPDVVEALVALVPQLSSTSPLPSPEQVDEMVGAPGTVLLVARLGTEGPIVGSLALVVFRIPTAQRAWIEDVVVDSAARGRGVGSALVEGALVRAAELGCRTVDLTSRPSRHDANRLYQRLGFVTRETNVYRISLEPDEEAP